MLKLNLFKGIYNNISNSNFATLTQLYIKTILNPSIEPQIPPFSNPNLKHGVDNILIGGGI